MTPRSSLFTRFARAALALATVWSLGCCGFEPLMQQLFAAESGATMACADGAGAAMGASDVDSAASVDAASVSTISALPAQPSPDATCNCTNCQAPTPPAAVASLATAPVPMSFATVSVMTPGVAPAPLVPPPQGRAAEV